MIVLNVPLAASLTLPVWAAIVVGITTGCLAFIANIPLFPAIPATVIGYALTFAYLLQGDAKRLTTDNLLSVAPTNPLVCMTLSLLVAAAFGIVSLKLATILSTKSPMVAPAE